MFLQIFPAVSTEYLTIYSVKKRYKMELKVSESIKRYQKVGFIKKPVNIVTIGIDRHLQKSIRYRFVVFC